MSESQIVSAASAGNGIGNHVVLALELRPLSWRQQNDLSETLARQRGEKKQEKPHLLCNQCRHLITRNEHAIPIAGQHRHTFINPAGIPYQIGCFSAAQGCFLVGEPSLEFTWFPGYQWCYAMCDRCFNHLGWHYQSGDHHFFGLILNRLIGDA